MLYQWKYKFVNVDPVSQLWMWIISPDLFSQIFMWIASFAVLGNLFCAQFGWSWPKPKKA